jgi:DNA-binding XRE family transcriptional regulator
MPTAPDNHHAHDCAERIRGRLPRRLQELREASRLSMYALWQKCGVSRDTISRIEGGETIPGVQVLAVWLCGGFNDVHSWQTAVP